MFYECRNLISLDLRTFNTSLVTTMVSMFGNCRNLISINLSNFNTSSVKNMEYMFGNCINLISIDLSNFHTSSSTRMNDMFFNCSSGLVYCINEISNNSLLSHITLKTNNYDFKDNNNCSNICFHKNKKLIFESKICILNCSYPFQFEYNNICYSSCPNGTYNMANNQCILNDINYGITISSNFFNNDNNYNFTSIHLY